MMVIMSYKSKRRFTSEGYRKPYLAPRDSKPSHPGIKVEGWWESPKFEREVRMAHQSGKDGWCPDIPGHANAIIVTQWESKRWGEPIPEWEKWKWRFVPVPDQLYNDIALKRLGSDETGSVLNQIFHDGQNDFDPCGVEKEITTSYGEKLVGKVSPQKCPSASAGDVIIIGQRKFLIGSLGFKEVT